MAQPQPRPPRPYYEDAWVRLYQADAGDLAFLGADTVDLIVTSPPYNLEVGYNTHRDDMPYPDYLACVRRWARSLYHVAAVGGRACVDVPLDTNRGGKRPIYADYVAAFLAAGWQYHTTIVWNESNISRRTAWGSWLSASAPFVTAPVEMIAVFYKARWRRPPAGRTSTIARDDFLEWTLGLWTFHGEQPRKVGHPAPFPEELPRRLIQLYAFAEDLVLDPFCGSGTTCVVAKSLGRRCIGVDIDPDYLARAAQRCARQPAPG